MLWHAIPPHFPPIFPRFSPFFPVFPHFSPFSPIFPHFPHFSHFSVAQKRLGDSGVGDFQGLTERAVRQEEAQRVLTSNGYESALALLCFIVLLFYCTAVFSCIIIS